MSGTFQGITISLNDIYFKRSTKPYYYVSIEGLFGLDYMEPEWYWYLETENISINAEQKIIYENQSQSSSYSWKEVRDKALAYISSNHPQVEYSGQVKSGDRFNYYCFSQSKTYGAKL